MNKTGKVNFGWPHIQDALILSYMKRPLTPGISRREFLRRSSLTTALFALRQAWAADVAPALMPGKKLGVALAGLGTYATGQLGPALKQTQNCRLVGVVTRRPEVGAQWAKDYGFPEKSIYNYDTMDRLADNPDIDIVYVVTPNGLHAEHVVKAAKAGKHVICEKPMANTVAECDTMLAACRAAKRSLSIGYRLHFDPYHMELMRLAKDPDFEPFKTIAGHMAFMMTTQQWRIEKKLSGGGPMMDIGIYPMHTTCLAADASPIAVTAHEPPKKRPEFFTEVEESIEWLLEFPNDVKATGSCSYNDTSSDFRADGAKGWYELKPAYSYRGLAGSTSRGLMNFNPPVNQQARLMDAVAQSIIDGRPSPVSGEWGRRDMVIIEGTYKSAATGQRVELKYS